MLHSLRARLALWLLLPLAVLVGLCGWFAHEHAEDAAEPGAGRQVLHAGADDFGIMRAQTGHP